MTTWKNGAESRHGEVLPLDWKSLVAESDLVAFYEGNGDLLDSGPNGYHLAESGTTMKSPIMRSDYKRFQFNGIGELILANPAHNTHFALDGEYSCFGLITCYAESAFHIASYDSPTSGSSDDNALWYLQRGGQTSSFDKGALVGGWEYGTQTPAHFTGTAELAIPQQDETLFVWQRVFEGGTWKQYGYLQAHAIFASPGSNANQASGGANSGFRIGSSGSGARARCEMRCLGWSRKIIIPDAITEEAKRIGVR